MPDQVSGLGEPAFEVVIPFGRQRQPGLRPAGALADLSRKRVGFAWDQLFNGDLVFDAIAAELGGTGAMRVGRQANTSVGRFVRLYMRNVAGLRVRHR